MKTMPVPRHIMPYGVLFKFFVISILISTNHACNKADRESLSSSFDAPSLNWSSSSDCCHWEGITCDEDGRVTHLLLPSKRLHGGVSCSLGNLTHLSHLNLSHNLLSGFLEAGMFLSLSYLEILDLSYNLFFGEVPLSLSSSYIRTVDFSSNQFNGTIPSSFLQHAWNLSSLNVSNNHFTGQIPSSICLRSSSLRVLDFSHNSFSGSIPLGLGNCSELEVFRAGENTLSGSLPSDIYNAQALQEISLHSNRLFGPISENIGKLSSLKLMLLHFNNLEGPLPPPLMNCTNLVEINLGFNHFSGNISVLDFSELTQLSKLDFFANLFTGILPISLYSCKSLKALRLAENNLEGQIQPEIVSLKSLSFLSLSENRLTNATGAMKILMGCKSLRVLLLSENFLGEEMPDVDIMDESSGFQNLSISSFYRCQLTGQVPLWLLKLKKLEVLDLSFNRLTGPIPGWLGTLPSLFLLILNHNLISGEFPKELCRLQALVSQNAATQTGYDYLELPIYYQRVNASVTPLQYKYLSNMPRAISLRNNSLSGNIPFEIGQLQLLRELDLSVNNLSGEIPNQISNLTSLERFDLSRNHLSGEIPASISSLHFLSSFTVAYNNLQGIIPSGTQIEGLNATAFEGNQGLCGAPLPNKCQQMNISNDTKDVHTSDEKGVPWFHFSVIFGFIFGFWGVCGSLVFIRSWRHGYFLFLSNVKDKFLAMAN
nr:receptor-like protein 3 [Malus domestica]